MAADPLASLGAGLAAYVRELVDARLAKHVCQPPAPAEDGGARLLTLANAARRASVGRSTLARWIAAGLPMVALPGREAGKEIRRVRADDLDRWIDLNGRRSVAGGAPAAGARGGRGRSGAASSAGTPTSLHAAVMARAAGQQTTRPAARRGRRSSGARAAS